MESQNLHEVYSRLRHQLNDAYTAPVWDSRRIDTIADQMVPVEAALAAGRSAVSLDARQPHCGATS